MKFGLTLAFLMAVCGASLALPDSTATTKPAATTKKKAASSKTTAAKKTRSSKSARKAPAASRQQQPTPERYREIQQALADKGYLKSEPSGVWDADSAAALAQFQNDRKLPPTGKLTSASLIDLGLGPSTAPVPPDPARDSASHAASNAAASN